MDSAFMLPAPEPSRIQCRKYAVEEWEAQRSEIEDLYVNQGLKLKDVMERLEQNYGFVATQKQLKSRITKWGFATKNLKGDVMMQLARTWVKQNRADAKGSSFRVNKKATDERTRRKINRYLKRKHISEDELLSAESPVCDSPPLSLTPRATCLPLPCPEIGPGPLPQLRTQSESLEILEPEDQYARQSYSTTLPFIQTIPSVHGPDARISTPRPDSEISQFRHYVLRLEQDFHETFPPEAIPTSHVQDASPLRTGPSAFPTSYAPISRNSTISQGSTATNPLSTLSPSTQEIPKNLQKLWDMQTCGIFSTEDGLNPFRDLIWSLASQSKALYHAVVAITAFNLPHDMFVVQAHEEHFSRSMSFLHSELRGHINLPIETAVATTLLLSLTRRGSPMAPKRLLHSSSSASLITIALHEYRRRGNPVGLRFLLDTWLHMDVLARFLCTDGYEPTEFNAIFLALYPPRTLKRGSRDSSIRGGTRNFILLISQAATLCGSWGQRRDLDAGVRGELLDTSRGLESQLSQWQPRSTTSADESMAAHSSAHMAEAYRHAAIITLQRMRSEESSADRARWCDLGRTVIGHLRSIPVCSHAAVAQIFPLLVAGCEVVEREDREWVRARWALMALRLRIEHVERCRRAVEEVWSRRDSRRVAIEQGNVSNERTCDIDDHAVALGAFRNWSGLLQDPEAPIFF